MKKIIVLVFFITLSTASFAGNNIALGFGQPYGGFLGIKLSHRDEKNRYYASLGSYGSIGEGFGIGFDRSVFSDSHSLGIFYGVVAGESNNVETTRYIGAMVNYQFYTSSFSEKSWLFGISVGHGKADKHQYNSKSSGSVLFNIGYQF